MAEDPKYNPMSNVHRVLRELKERLDSEYDASFEKPDDDVVKFKKATEEAQ